MKAELIALSYGTQQAVIEGAVLLYSDTSNSKGALTMAKNRRCSLSTKYIVLCFKPLEQLVKSGTSTVAHKGSEYMLVDIFTKYLKIMGLRDVMA